MNVKKDERKKINKLAAYDLNKKFERIAVEILLFSSLCFTITQLHSNSFLHHVSPIDVRSVLEHLIKCELLEFIHKGVKTSGRFTSVYIKRLPHCQPDGKVDNEHRLIFDEKLKKFKYHHPELTINEYLKKNTMITLQATGVVMDELVKFFYIPEYAKIDLSPLYNLKEAGNDKQTVANKSNMNDQAQSVKSPLLEINDNSKNDHRCTNDYDNLVLLNYDYDVSCHFAAVTDMMEQKRKQTNSFLGSQFKNDIVGIDIDDNVDIQHMEQVTINNSDGVSVSVTYSQRNNDAHTNRSKRKQKKRKHMAEKDSQGLSIDDSDMTSYSPPTWRLRSEKHSDDDKNNTDRREN